MTLANAVPNVTSQTLLRHTSTILSFLQLHDAYPGKNPSARRALAMALYHAICSGSSFVEVDHLGRFAPDEVEDGLLYTLLLEARDGQETILPLSEDHIQVSIAIIIVSSQSASLISNSECSTKCLL